MPIYGDLYQVNLKGVTNENHLVTHMGFTSGPHYDVIKIAYIVSVQFKHDITSIVVYGDQDFPAFCLPFSVEMYQVHS